MTLSLLLMCFGNFCNYSSPTALGDVLVILDGHGKEWMGIIRRWEWDVIGIHG